MIKATIVPPAPLPMDPNEIAFNSDVETYGMLGVYMEYIQVIKFKTQSKFLTSELGKSLIQPNFLWSLKNRWLLSVKVSVTLVDLSGNLPTNESLGWPAPKFCSPRNTSCQVIFK